MFDLHNICRSVKNDNGNNNNDNDDNDDNNNNNNDNNNNNNDNNNNNNNIIIIILVALSLTVFRLVFLIILGPSGSQADSFQARVSYNSRSQWLST